MSIIKANSATLKNAVSELQLCVEELEKYGFEIKGIQKQIAKATEYEFSGNLLLDILNFLSKFIFLTNKKASGGKSPKCFFIVHVISSYTCRCLHQVLEH